MAVVKGNFTVPANGLSYSVSRDGKRFLMIQNAQRSSPPPELVLVFNWFDELKRLVP